MPYILVQVTDEGVTLEQKKKIIEGATELMVRVLNKDPATTFVVIEEISMNNWGVAGQTVAERRQKKSINN